MVWKPKSPAIIHVPAEALDRYGNPRIGGGCPSPHRMMMAAAAGGGFAPKSVVFDGTNDYIKRDSTLADWDGNADGQQGICSFWGKMNDGDVLNHGVIMSEGYKVWIDRGGSGGFRFILQAGGVIGRIDADSAINVAFGAFHAICSWDLSVPVIKLYINNIENTGNITQTIGTIDYTRIGHYIGCYPNLTSKADMDLSELYFNNLDYLDLDTAGNRLLFNNGGIPVDLGSDGSIPTGNPPRAYFSVREGDAASDFATNRGTGGTVAIVGALTISGTDPGY